MRVRDLFDDETAVSSVISIVLMVAIAVILAAVVATFALSVGGDVQDTKTAGFGVSQETKLVEGKNGRTSNNPQIHVRITHKSGDTLELENVETTVNGYELLGNPGEDLWGRNTGPTVVKGFDNIGGGSGESIDSGDSSSEFVAYVPGGLESITGVPYERNSPTTDYIWDYNDGGDGTMDSSDNLIFESDSGSAVPKREVIYLEPGDVIRINWEDDTGSSSTLYEYNVK